MRVKIIKCSKDTFWYHDRIGSIFEVLPIDQRYPEDYLVNTSNIPDHRGYILKEDGEIIPDDQFSTLTEIVKQLESCGYTTEDSLHLLVDNKAFISLKEMAKKEQHV